MIALRKELGSSSRIIASGVNQKEAIIDAAEEYWMAEIGVDYFIKRKFLTWGANTTLDDSRSADKTPYIDTNLVPCPFLFERLNIDSRGNVMVCGYDIAANTSLGNVTQDTIHDIWHGEGFGEYRQKHLDGLGKSIPLCSDCPDWKYRSWKHNYWKVVEGAKEARAVKLGEHDDFAADRGEE